MRDFGKIFLTWRKGRGYRRIPVGFLTRNVTDGARFQYDIEKVKEAQQYGFIPYTGFPETSKVYSGNVIEIFGQRLLKSGRNDASDFYRFWSVDPKKKDDVFYMLAQTQGLIPTDNFEFLADFNAKAGLSFVTELVGLSRIDIFRDDLEKEESLNYSLEPNNPIDKYAVAVNKNGKKLGYVKIIHSRVFYKAKSGVSVKVHHVEGNGKLSRVFLRVQI